MTTKGRTAKSSVDWFCPGAGFDNTPAALGAGSQLTAIDQAIKNPMTSQAYDSGAVVGLRLWLSLNPSAIVGYAPFWVLMVLPNGLAVPSVTSPTLRKQAERYIWAMGLMDADTVTAAATWYSLGKFGGLVLSTARTFDSGDRLVLAIYNPGAVAFGAGAAGEYVIDCYVRES